MMSLSCSSSDTVFDLSSRGKSDTIVHCMDINESDCNFHKPNHCSTNLSSFDPDEYAFLAEQVQSQSQSPVKFLTLFRYAAPHDIAALILAYICAILSGAALPLTNFILGRVTQDFSNLITKDLAPEDFQPSVNKYALYFVYLGLGVGVLSFISTFLLADRGEILAARIRQHYFAAIIRQNTAYFEHIGYSEVTKRIIDDTHLIQEAISETSGIAITCLSLFISSIVVGFISSWKVTLFMICAMLCISLCSFIGFSVVKKWDKCLTLSHLKTAGLVSQIIRSIQTSAALGASQKHAKRLNKQWIYTMRLAFRRSYVIAIMVACCWSIVYLAYAVGFWQGSIEVQNDAIDPGELIATITAIVMGGFSLSTMWPAINCMYKGIEAGERIFETIDRESAVDSTSIQGITLQDLKGKVEFRNVKLRFPSNPDQIVINDFSLKIDPGETVAIVGPLGAGKSALLGLVERYYDPVKGSVLIDDINISQLNIQSLRQHIAYVSQEAFLFSGTIYDNVAQGLDRTPYADKGYDIKLQMVTKACREANAWGFILAMKDGLESQVGERGCRLSISQRQRIAIARAIVSKPKIFLLDDATSALNSRSEMFLQETLSNISKSLTTVIVTQKLSMLRNAQRIIVMKDGMISDQGTHLELMSSNTWYREFVEKQRGKKGVATAPLMMFNRDRKPSEISVRSARSVIGNKAFDILDWNSSVASIAEPNSIPSVKKAPGKIASLSSSSLIGLVSGIFIIFKPC